MQRNWYDTNPYLLCFHDFDDRPNVYEFVKTSRGLVCVLKVSMHQDSVHPYIIVCRSEGGNRENSARTCN